MMYYQADDHVLDALVLFIGEECNEYGHGTTVCIGLDALWLEGTVINQAL